MSDLPEGINFGLAAEINLAVILFHELPEEEQSRLAAALKEEPQNSEPYADAGIEVFMAIMESSERLTTHMNNIFFGKDGVFHLYVVMPDDLAGKTERCARYFRDNLNGTEIGEIQLPER